MGIKRRFGFKKFRRFLYGQGFGKNGKEKRGVEIFVRRKNLKEKRNFV